MNNDVLKVFKINHIYLQWVFWLEYPGLLLILFGTICWRRNCIIFGFLVFCSCFDDKRARKLFCFPKGLQFSMQYVCKSKYSTTAKCNNVGFLASRKKTKYSSNLSLHNTNLWNKLIPSDTANVEVSIMLFILLETTDRMKDMKW